MPEEICDDLASAEIQSMVLEAVIIRACRFCGGANPDNLPLCPGCGRAGNAVEKVGTVAEWHKQEGNQ